ncbi:MAG: hypothetical protein HFJ89_10835 [Oscillospiraceae bacterium]|nr:hypothetical protein [Oscillospiraceae bacterium]
MNFLKNRYLYYEHLLSYSTRVKASELIDMLMFTKNNVDALHLKAVENVVFRIVEIIPDSGGDIYGIEVLIPTDKAFKSEGQCIYKPEFKINNAVSFMFYDVNEICEAETQLYGYARKNNMKLITDIYFILLQSEKINRVNAVFEAYVGISNNIV